MASEKTKFKAVVEMFAELEKTSSSTEMIDILAKFFTSVSPEEARNFAYLSRGKVTPDYEGTEFGIAGKLVTRAIAQAADEEPEKVEKRFSEMGDLGDVAEVCIDRSRSSGLTLAEVFEQLEKLARAEGSGSQDEKISILAELLSKSSAAEAKYLVRIVLGTLRLGVGDMTFLNGLSKSLTGSKKEKSKLEHAFNVWSDLGAVAEQAKANGIDAITGAEPSVGVPVRMMLAQRASEASEAAEHIEGAMVAEYKYDGERIQAHIDKNGNATLYSRRHENITYQFPDVVEALKKSFTCTDAIVEGEVVAINKETGKLEDFQTLSVRRRKHNIEEYVKNVPVKFFLFDILYLDDDSKLSQPLEKRRNILADCMQESEGVVLSKHITTKDPEELESFFAEAMSWGAEGIMIKDATAEYVAGSRGWRWVKFKRDYKQSLTDTFDLVVVGALHGKGRRGGTYGSLLVAAFDPESNVYCSFTKVGAGFTDENLGTLSKKLDTYKQNEKHRLVETGMEADVWFEPAVVMEVAGAEITVSQMHTVAKEKVKDGGLALRFPRFLRWRDDKDATQTTTTDEIYEMYKKL